MVIEKRSDRDLVVGSHTVCEGVKETACRGLQVDGNTDSILIFALCTGGSMLEWLAAEQQSYFAPLMIRRQRLIAGSACLHERVDDCLLPSRCVRRV
jgi:hypothetical protein